MLMGMNWDMSLHFSVLAVQLYRPVLLSIVNQHRPEMSKHSSKQASKSQLELQPQGSEQTKPGANEAFIIPSPSTMQLRKSQKKKKKKKNSAKYYKAQN